MSVFVWKMSALKCDWSRPMALEQSPTQVIHGESDDHKPLGVLTREEIGLVRHALISSQEAAELWLNSVCQHLNHAPALLTCGRAAPCCIGLHPVERCVFVVGDLTSRIAALFLMHRPASCDLVPGIP